MQRFKKEDWTRNSADAYQILQLNKQILSIDKSIAMQRTAVTRLGEQRRKLSHERAVLIRLIRESEKNHFGSSAYKNK